MTIFNFGSINIDHVHGVERIARPGETVAARSYVRGLGGKGCNQSVAAAAAGARVVHIGAVGEDGGWTVDRLAAAGVDVSGIARLDEATGHAMIEVDAAGENVIVIWGGANRALTLGHVVAGLSDAEAGDWLLLQNETSLAREAVEYAAARELRVCYSAAPFSAEATAAVIDSCDLVAVNAHEAALLAGHFGCAVEALPVKALLVTDGANGATWRGPDGEVFVPSFEVRVVDTTGAGDTFLGYFLAGLDTGAPPSDALTRAAAAAALQVGRPGAADAIPSGEEVDRFLRDRIR